MENVTSCMKQLQVTSTYATQKDDFQSLVKGLPTKAIIDEHAKLQKLKEHKQDTNDAGTKCKEAVVGIKSVPDLCCVVVTLISNAKNVVNDNTSKTRCYVTLDELEKIDLSTRKLGKSFFCVVYIQSPTPSRVAVGQSSIALSTQPNHHLTN